MSDKKFQRMIKIGLLGVLVIALCFAVIFFFQYKAALKDPRNNIVYQNSDEELGINPTVAEELKDYRCMAFYGLDEDGVSGVIIVAAIEWDTHHCKIFKVDADTYMELAQNRSFVIKGQERSKFACSYAYSRAGLVSSMKMLNRHLDLAIREGIGMNLVAAEKITDDLGGINVPMSKEMVKEINTRFNHPGEIKYKNGTAKLNGRQVVEYLSTCNNAYTALEVDAASAFNVFVSLISTAKNKSEDNLLSILNTAYRGCDTNMNVKDLAVFVKEIDSYEVEATSSWPYTYKNKLVGGYNVEVPDTLASNVKRLHKEVFGQDNYKPTKTCGRLSTQNK